MTTAVDLAITAAAEANGGAVFDLDRAHIWKCFSRMPERFKWPVARQYAGLVRRQGRRAANLHILKVSMAEEKSYRLASDDAELTDWAAARARRFSNAIASRRGDADAIASFFREEARGYGVEPPEVDAAKGVTAAGVLARLGCPLWWRRAARRWHGRRVERVAREIGLVHKGEGIYSSDETLYRRRGQKRRNRLMLEECLAVNELGEEFTLAELAALSVSNPAIRRGELMTRIAGFEAVADDLGHVGEFITLTCPSRMHAYMLKGRKSIPNPKFFDMEPSKRPTPRDAQAYLSGVWARIRAKLARHGIRLYGFRVAEPNHDGCPHWHLLVFMPPWARRRVRMTFRRYALEDSPNEPGARKHRVTFKAIDKARGTAAGYIAKYVAKNIDGHALDADLYGNDPIEAAERVDAWAACWGIRQFQPVGGPPVTVWRECRRIDWEEVGTVGAAIEAADRGDWAGFVMAMGGPLVKRDELPLRVAYMQEIDRETGELPLNRYGELAAGAVFGLQVQATGAYLVTRWHEWTIQRKGQDSASAATAAPWSSVNNCTRQPAANSPPMLSPMMGVDDERDERGEFFSDWVEYAGQTGPPAAVTGAGGAGFDS